MGLAIGMRKFKSVKRGIQLEHKQLAQAAKNRTDALCEFNANNRGYNGTSSEPHHYLFRPDVCYDRASKWPLLEERLF
jgi:hypothetical protein